MFEGKQLTCKPKRSHKRVNSAEALVRVIFDRILGFSKSTPTISDGACPKNEKFTFPVFTPLRQLADAVQPDGSIN
jgi:hypothetical protein